METMSGKIKEGFGGTAHTRFASAGQHDGLEPGGQVVHDRKVAHRHHETGWTNKHWDFHREQRRRQHWLSGKPELHNNEADQKDDRQRQRDVHCRRRPLAVCEKRHAFKMSVHLPTARC